MRQPSSQVPPLSRKVLLGTDFSAASQAAFCHALEACRALGARLCLVHVFEYSNAAPPETGGLLGQMHELYREAEDKLGALSDHARREGVSCGGRVVCGEAAPELLKTLRNEAMDLAILGTRGIHGFERLVFGSTADAVLRKSSCPVVVVGPHTLPPLPTGAKAGPVVFATDFHRSTTGAIRFASSFAAGNQAKLHCLHVLPRSLQVEANTEVVPGILRQALQQVAQDAEPETGAAVCAVEYGGEISSAIVQYAAKVGARLIVLGVRRAGLLTAHAPAHIAYRVITEAPCPVMTIAYAEQHQGTLAACL